MKKTILAILVVSSIVSCQKDNLSNINFRQEMRDFVIEISEYAKVADHDFVVIPQNGIELVSNDGNEAGTNNQAYIMAIDGNGQEDLFYGFDEDNKATSTSDNVYLKGFLDISLAAGNKILVTDYCSSPANIDDSYSKNNVSKYVSFAADDRELGGIPSYPVAVFEENDDTILSLSQVKNFLYLINPGAYSARQNFINAVVSTNYDLLIMDLFFNDNSSFTAAEIAQLKQKNNGGFRMVICYMSIGEAEDYRYYWQPGWSIEKPAWMDKENPDWKGNFKVRYWEKEWKNIIFGNDHSYLQMIIDAEFDGVYLDIVDAFEFYE